MEVGDDSDIDNIGRLDDSDIEEKIFSAIYAMKARAPRGMNQGQGKGKNQSIQKYIHNSMRQRTQQRFGLFL